MWYSGKKCSKNGAVTLSRMYFSGQKVRRKSPEKAKPQTTQTLNITNNSEKKKNKQNII